MRRVFISLGVIVLLAIISFVAVVWHAANVSLEAENNLHRSRFVIGLVERFVKQHDRWPASWQDLESVSRRALPQGLSDKNVDAYFDWYDWPKISLEIQKHVHVDFNVNPHEVAEQRAYEFTAVRPIGPKYEYRDYGDVESLQKAIRQHIRQPDEANARPSDTTAAPATQP